VTSALAAPHPQTQEPPFSPALVEEMVRLLVKASRAHQLYLQNNPIHARAIELARASFAPIWQQTDSLVIVIADAELRWEGRVVHAETEKASEGLAWLLFKDGLRALHLQEGFEGELVPFLDILQRVRRAHPDEDDLLTLLWEQDFSHLRYEYVDLHGEEVASMDGPRGEERASEGWGADDVAEETGAAQANAVVNIQDFDSTLYFLDDKEVAYLQDGVAREYSDDLRRNVLSMLFDIYETQSDASVRDEIGGILQTLVPHLLSAGELRAVAYLLSEAETLAAPSSKLAPQHRTQLTALADRLSDAAALSQLMQSLDESAESGPREDLVALFAQLRPAALGTTLAWIGRVQNARLRALLEEAAARLAGANTAELVRLIGHEDRAIAFEAIRRAGALKSPAAVQPLAKVLTEGGADLRLAAVQALAEIASPSALQTLEKATEDEGRDVRVAAVRAVAARMHRPALARIEHVVKGKSLREADLTERMAFFEAYGALCGDAGVPLLDAMLNAKGFLGRREEPELRACAAMALGRVRSPLAQDALGRATADKEALVRNAVNRALRGVSA
jgi:HEAT repeat protein